MDTKNLDKSQMLALLNDIEFLTENPVGATVQDKVNYQQALFAHRLDIGKAFNTGDYKDGKPVLNYYRPLDPWTDEGDKQWLGENTAEFAEKRQLVELVKKVSALAHTLPGQLKAVMQHDAVYNMTPEAQLEYCVHQSKGYDAGTLAKCLYTSYFYGPINTFLRKQLPGSVDSKIIDLITYTLGVLEKTIKNDKVVHQIETFRVELKSEWMKNPGKGQVLDFPAFTSTHPSEGGVDTMLKDIAKGTFGEVGEPAVLKFQGRTKVLQPNVKYFPEEVETIIPPGMRAKVAHVDVTTLDIPGKGKTAVKLYTLEIQ
ncbi:hypothetical protein [Massilia endophytica]|uniref:hypothetical protein n=1 Tax=Massilia endophytica TaxID=2899220 RepID=UPI001E4B40E6|nr:hypothetical protein [Massilia endophytica]UGQ47476.1 hypothetical protein LSQ66_03060 [Massilia endophytica]